MFTLPPGSTINIDIPVVKENGYNASTTFSVSTPASSGLTTSVAPSTTLGTEVVTLRLAVTAAATATSGSVSLIVTGVPAPLADLTIPLLITNTEGGYAGGGSAGTGALAFTARSVNGYGWFEFSVAAPAAGYTYAWDFGGGKTASGEKAVFYYPNDAPFGPRTGTVTLTATATDGQKSTATLTVNYTSPVSPDIVNIIFGTRIIVPQALMDQIKPGTLKLAIYPNGQLNALQTIKGVALDPLNNEAYVDGVARATSNGSPFYVKALGSGDNYTRMAFHRITNADNAYLNWVGLEYLYTGAGVSAIQDDIRSHNNRELSGVRLIVTGELKTPVGGVEPQFEVGADLWKDGEPITNPGAVYPFTLSVNGKEDYVVYTNGAPSVRSRTKAVLTKG